MIEIYETTQVKCDACGKIKKETLALIGSSCFGWSIVNEKDLCNICMGLLAQKILNHLPFNSELNKLVNTLIQETPPHNPHNDAITLI